MIQQSRPSRGLIIGIAAVIAAIVIVALIAVFARGGSSSSTVSETNPAQTPATANAGQQTAANSGQTSGSNFTRLAGSVRAGDLAVKVDSVQTLSVAAPESSMKYVVLEISVQNVASSYTEDVLGMNFRLIDSDGQQAKIQGGSAERDRLGDVGKRYESSFGAKVQPGQTAQVVLVFKIPRDTNPARIEFSQNGASGIIPLK